MSQALQLCATVLMYFRVYLSADYLDLIHRRIEMDMQPSTETLHQALPTWFESEPPFYVYIANHASAIRCDRIYSNPTGENNILSECGTNNARIYPNL